MTAPTRSLRTSLLIWLLVPLGLILPLRAWLEFQRSMTHTQEAFDRAMADTALALANLVGWDKHAAGGRATWTLSHDTERSLRTDRTDRVFLALVGPKLEAAEGDPALASLPLQRQHRTTGNAHYFNATLDGQAVRGVSQPVACGPYTCEVRVAETLIKREEIRREALRGTAGFVAILVIAELLVALVAVRLTFAPLRRLSAAVAQRESHDLSPLDAAHVPAEVYPLITAINDLLGRVRESTEAQRAFLADAAHQLRTPLTSLRTEAELALLESRDPQTRPALERIHGAAERAGRLASQLLAQARTDSSRHRSPSEPFDLRQVAEQAAVDWVPQALSANVDLGFQLEAAPVQGHPFLLRELLGNLIHNALEYAQPARGGATDARVTVRTRREGAWSILEVEDNGPGIAPQDRERVLQRFQRGPQGVGTGSGLGLAIVADIVAQHHGRLELLDAKPEADNGDAQPLAGLCVRASFPAAPG